MENIEDNKPVNETITPKVDNLVSIKKSKTVFNFIKNNGILVASVIGIIAAVGIYFWKDIKAKNQKQEIEQKATVQLMQNGQQMLKLLAKPLVWSIRSEMIRSNIEQVNVYTADLVKEKNVQFIHIVGPDGIIIVSTDKKLEGQASDGLFDSKLLQADSAIVVNKDDKMLTLLAPIMGYDKRLGTLVLNYAATSFKIKNELAISDTSQIK